jgi:hypothetical protein
MPSTVCHTSHVETYVPSALHTLRLPRKTRPFPDKSQLEQSDALGVPLASMVNETQFTYSSADGKKTMEKLSNSRTLVLAPAFKAFPNAKWSKKLLGTAPWAAIAKSKLASIAIQATTLRIHFPFIGENNYGLKNAPITGGPAKNPDSRPVYDYLMQRKVMALGWQGNG